MNHAHTWRRLRHLLALLLLAVHAWAAGASFEWRDIVQEVVIAPDGTVVVTDERTLWTPDADFGEAFICVEHPNHVRLTLLVGSGAVSPGPDAFAFQQPCSVGTEMVVRNAVRVQERRIRFVYRLEGTVEAFSDVVVWSWNLIQFDHPPIVDYALTVVAPGPMAAPYDAFVMRYANPEVPQVRLSEDGSTLTVKSATSRTATGSRSGSSWTRGRSPCRGRRPRWTCSWQIRPGSGAWGRGRARRRRRPGSRSADRQALEVALVGLGRRPLQVAAFGLDEPGHAVLVELLVAFHLAQRAHQHGRQRGQQGSDLPAIQPAGARGARLDCLAAGGAGSRRRWPPSARCASVPPPSSPPKPLPAVSPRSSDPRLSSRLPSRSRSRAAFREERPCGESLTLFDRPPTRSGSAIDATRCVGHPHAVGGEAGAPVALGQQGGAHDLRQVRLVVRRRDAEAPPAELRVVEFDALAREEDEPLGGRRR